MIENRYEPNDSDKAMMELMVRNHTQLMFQVLNKELNKRGLMIAVVTEGSISAE